MCCEYNREIVPLRAGFASTTGNTGKSHARSSSAAVCTVPTSAFRLLVRVWILAGSLSAGNGMRAEDSRHAPTGTLASDGRREGTGQQIVHTGVATRVHLQAVARWVPDKL